MEEDRNNDPHRDKKTRMQEEKWRRRRVWRRAWKSTRREGPNPTLHLHKSLKHSLLDCLRLLLRSRFT